MDEVQAANTSRTKNRAPKRDPPGISPKAMGRVTKMSPGPLPGSSPWAKTMGKMASPASSATRVSVAAIIKVLRAMEASCRR